MYFLCSYPNCNNQLQNVGGQLCDRHFSLVVQYEEALDKWLEINHPSIFLEDVLGWYTKCVKTACERDCLDCDEFNICECCPHKLTMGYQSFKIENMIMPTKDFLDNI